MNGQGELTLEFERVEIVPAVISAVISVVPMALAWRRCVWCRNDYAGGAWLSYREAGYCSAKCEKDSTSENKLLG